LKKKRENLTATERAKQQQDDEEARILRGASQVQTNALQAASELAKGVVYKKSLPMSWRCPKHILKEGEQNWEITRKKWPNDRRYFQLRFLKSFKILSKIFWCSL